MSGPRTLVWAAVLVLAGCDGGVGQACPAIGWSNLVRVHLGDGWPDGEGRSVRLDCGTPCDPGMPSGAPTAAAPVEGSVARVVLGMVSPETVAVAVLGPEGDVQAELTADLEWVRVGGSAGCGGPHEATVTVPAP